MSAGGQRTQTTPGDPEIREFNRLVLNQLQSTLPLAGGLPGITEFRPGAIPGRSEMDILAQLGQTFQQPAMTGLERFGIGQLQGLGQVQPLEQAGLGQLLGAAQVSPFELGGVAGLFGGAQANPLETQGLQAMFGAADPTARLQAAQQAFQQFAAPGITNQLTAAGLGRGGAIGEALALGNQAALLPILQQAAQQQQAAGQAGIGLGGTVGQRGIGANQALLNLGNLLRGGQQQAGQALLGTAGQVAGRGTTAAQAALGLGPSVQSRELDFLTRGLQVAGIPRQAQLGEESRRGDILLGLLGSTPLSQSGAGQLLAVQRPDFFTPSMQALGALFQGGGQALSGSAGAK